MLEVYFKLISIKNDKESIKYPYSLSKEYTFTKKQIEVYYNDTNIAPYEGKTRSQKK